MSKLQAIQAIANKAAETGVDMNEVVKGGSARLLPEGWAFARFVEYVEFGNQPQEYQGQAKDPCLEVQLGFALYDTAERKYSNEDGTPYILRPFSFALYRNERAKAFKLFAAMNWKRTAQNFAQLLGEGYLVYIGHFPRSKTDDTLVSRIVLDKVLPAIDQVSGQPLPVPAARDEDFVLFSWDCPTMETWAELYREGTFDDGKSKNILQEKCLGATNFEGSMLQQLLMGNVPALPGAANAGLNSAPATTPNTPQGQSGAPGVGVTPVMTFPSNPTPVLPAIPSLPSIPGLPQ